MIWDILWLIAVCGQLVHYLWLKPVTDEVADKTWNACLYPGEKR